MKYLRAVSYKHKTKDKPFDPTHEPSFFEVEAPSKEEALKKIPSNPDYELRSTQIEEILEEEHEQ